jgi:hypothetical protein
MTLPANIRINVGSPFPSQVVGAAYITVAKANGLWTITPNYSLLVALASVANPAIKEVVIYDPTTGIYNTITLSQLSVIALSGTYRMVTIAGDVSIVTSDTTILLDKTVGAATNIDLPTSLSRAGVPVTVKDYKGDANINNITFVPAAGETIDGFSAAAAAANGLALINIALGKKTLYPLTSGGWYL